MNFVHWDNSFLTAQRLLFLFGLAGWLAVAIGLFTACDEKERPVAPQTVPLRVITHLPSLTETVFALGLGNRLVGVTDFCHYPAETAAIAKIGGIFTPSTEQVLALRPDLIVLDQRQPELVERYGTLGLRTLAVDTSNLPGIMATARAIAAALGAPEAAERFVADFQGRLDAVARRAAGRPAPKTLVIISHDPGELREVWAAVKGSFHDDLLRLAGGTNVFPNPSGRYIKIAYEELLALKPEIVISILTETTADPALVAREEALWRAAPQLLGPSSRVCPLVGEWMHVPGPRVPILAEAFFACLHGSPETAP